METFQSREDEQCQTISTSLAGMESLGTLPVILNPQRKRVSQACDICRRRKDKCDGRKPSCTACIKRNRSCSYDPKVRRRGLREGYVRDLESYAQGLDAYVADLEIVVSVLYQNCQQPEISCKDELKNAWSDKEKADELREVWHSSQLFMDLRDRDTATEKIDGSLQQRLKLRNAAMPSVDGNDGIEIDDEFENQMDNPEAALEQSVDKGRTLSALELPQSLRECSVISRPVPETTQPSIEFPANALQLLNIYFAHTHSWLPIVEKYDVLKTYHETTAESLKPPPRRSLAGPRAVLWSILAFADAQYTGCNFNVDERSGTPLPSSQAFYLHAHSHIPDEEGTFEIGHIQSLLILSLLKLGMNQFQAAWLLVGTAVRVTFQMGLHKPVSQFSGLHGGRRSRHVFLGCFVLDTLIAGRLGVPPHLTAEDVDNIGGKIEQGGLEEWESWSDCLNLSSKLTLSAQPSLICSTFNKLVATLQGLNKMLRKVSNLTAKDTTPSDMIEALKLSHNDKDGPSQLSSSWSEETILLPHHQNLHLAYFTVLMVFSIRQYKILSHDGRGDCGSLRSLSHSVNKTCQILRRYQNTFSISIAPPIAEYYFAVLRSSIVLLEQNVMIFGSMLNDNCRQDLNSSISSLSKVWPVFDKLRTAMDGELPASRTSDPTIVREPQPRFEDVVHEQNISDATSEMSEAAVTTVNKPNNVSENTHLLRGSIHQPIVTHRYLRTETSKPTSRIDNEELLASHVVDSTMSAISSDLRQSLPYSVPLEVNPEEQALNVFDEMDATGMFNEFTIMDAMEWSSIHDQSMLNLGFTSSEILDDNFFELYHNRTESD